MNENETSAPRCVNESCPRAAEPGERYCAACGLERSLFLRERREGPAEARTERPGFGTGR